MTIEDQHNKTVDRILKELLSDKETAGIFILWPSLANITKRFCDFVSPLIPHDEHTSVVAHTIAGSLVAFSEQKDELQKPHAYVIGLAKAAIDIMGIRICGVNRTKTMTWEPFIIPMKDWMVRNEIVTLRTTKKVEELSNQEKLIAKKSLLTHILTANEMTTFGIEI